jgi:hypothetical protein
VDEIDQREADGGEQERPWEQALVIRERQAERGDRERPQRADERVELPGVHERVDGERGADRERAECR